MDEEILTLLYRSFDDTLTPNERERLEAAMAVSAELRAERERIVAMRATVSRSGGQFKPFFSARVMQRLGLETAHNGALESFFASLLFVFRRVALVGTIVAALMLAYNLHVGGSLSFSAALGEPEITIEEILESPVVSVLE